MEESRTKKSARNVAFTLIARVITLILGFISRMIFLRFLSTEYLGINGLFSNVLTVLSFAELGIGNAIQFSLYKPVKEKNLERIKTLMLFYRNAYRIIAAFIMTVGLLLIPALDFIVEKKPDISENLIVIYILFVGQSAVSYLFSYKQTLLQADQNAYVVSIGNSVTNIVQNVLHVVILFATRSYYIYLISTIVCSVLNNVILA
ncbi:MAG: polysaccharide transporter, partial [Clostridia bacterium]|nr:polysaccharide transporter [Clostridia bacterium]